MARISAKQQLLDEQMKREEETILNRNTINCSNFLLQKMGLEIDNCGVIYKFIEDSMTNVELVFDGKKCKAIDARIDNICEMQFDPYNNVKLCCGLLQFYVIYYLARDTQLMALTNTKTNEKGQLILTMENGEEIVGNMYNKDTLKYIDMIVILEGATPLDYRELKGMDVDEVKR